MATPNAIRMGRAFVEIFADDRKFQKVIGRFQRKMRFIGQDLKTFGRTGAFAAATMLAPFLLSLKSYASFEKNMALVSTLLDDNVKDMEKYSAAVKRISEETGDNLSSLSTGLYDIVSGTISEDVDKNIEMLEIASKAAIAGNSDTATAVKALVSIMNSYNLKASEAGRVSDVMFNIIKNGVITFGELAPNIGKVAALAAAAKIPLEEMGVGIALMTKAGSSAEEAMTHLKAIINTFWKGGDKDGKALAKKLGFDLSASSLEAEGLIGIIRKIQGLSGDQIATLFPNIRAAGGLAKTLDKIAFINAAVEDMKNNAGDTERAYVKMFDTLWNYAMRAWAKISVLSTEIGEALRDDVVAALDMIGAKIKIFAKFVRENQELVKIAAKAVIAFGLLSVGIFLVGSAIGFFSMVLSGIGIAVFIIVKIFSVLLVTVGLLFKVLSIVLGLFTSWGGIITLVLGGLVIWLLKSLGVFREMKEFGVGVFQAFKDGWAETKGVAIESWEAILNALKAGDHEKASKVVTTAIEYLWEKLFNDIKIKAHESANDVNQEWIEFLEGLERKAAKTGTVLSGIFMGIGKTILLPITTLFKSLWTALDMSLTGYQMVMNKASGMFDPTFDSEAANAKLRDDFQGRADGTADSIGADAKSALNEFTSIPKNLEKDQHNYEVEVTDERAKAEVETSKNIDKLNKATREYRNAWQATVKAAKGVTKPDNDKVGSTGNWYKKIKEQQDSIINKKPLPLTTSVSGSFSNRVISRMKGSSLQKQIVDEIKTQTPELKKIVKNTKKKGMTLS